MTAGVWRRRIGLAILISASYQHKQVVVQFDRLGFFLLRHRTAPRVESVDVLSGQAKMLPQIDQSIGEGAGDGRRALLDDKKT